MAFSGIDNGLSVIELDPISGSTSYSYKQLVDDKSVLLTSAPAMVIAPNGNLIIRYGVDGQSQKNVAFVTTSTDGINFSTAQKTTGLAPTQSAMVVFKGALYVLDGQDNQYGGVFESTLDNNGFIVPNTTHQISGCSRRPEYQQLSSITAS